MTLSLVPPFAENLTHATNRSGSPQLRFLHYNDVYHIEPGSREPVGGIARFQTLCNYYRHDETFGGQTDVITVFSGDAFNPSLESSVTKGSHMVPVLNAIGTDVACVGNHDLDFGVPQFRHLADQCNFPWLLANVLDPALGDDVPLGSAQKTFLLTSSNGIKIGFIGLVEPTATAKELVPLLREQGAEIVIAITHAREPNDIKLAMHTGHDLIDLILGGHDHFYQHNIVNGTHILRSGTDFKQLSYIKAWRKEDASNGWDFEIIRRDVTKDVPEDPKTLRMVDDMTSALHARLEKPIGYTAAPLDARFMTVRLKESNMGNFVCDLVRFYYHADCCVMAAGTIRGDQVYPPGVLRMRDVMNCFPFEDPAVVLKVKGAAIWDALENSVSTYPALEGRFPQVSNIRFVFDSKAPPMSRLLSVEIAGLPIDTKKDYALATRDYMARGKDGYHTLLSTSRGGTAHELVSEENGLLISTILRQYFMSLKVLGRWKRWGKSMNKHWENVQEDLHELHPVRESRLNSPEMGGTVPAVLILESKLSSPELVANLSDVKMLCGKDDGGAKLPDGATASTCELHGGDDNDVTNGTIMMDDGSDSEVEDEKSFPSLRSPPELKAEANLPSHSETDREWEYPIMRKVLRKWWRVAGLKGLPGVEDEEGEFVVGWTKVIAPRCEGRIVIL